MAIRVQEAASVRLDEIYRYTRDIWGEAQAESYITGLFAAFEQIETRGVQASFFSDSLAPSSVRHAAPKIDGDLNIALLAESWGGPR